MRWQITPGAHPRYAPNPGTDVPRAEATEFVPIRITVHADSELNLPVAGE
ncbi:MULTISPECIES: hypothetical protein [unclassified Streptomyces]